MTIVNDSEVLAHEPDPWRPGRKFQIIAVVIVLVAVVGFMVDRKQREDEAAALTRCSQSIDTAIAAALVPVDAMVAYVRPTRDGASAQLSGELDAMVAGQTERASGHLTPVVAACREIEVLSYHGAEKDRRRDCLARLALAAKYFEAVSEDGSIAFQPRAFDRRPTDC